MLMHLQSTTKGTGYPPHSDTPTEQSVRFPITHSIHIMHGCAFSNIIIIHISKFIKHSSYTCDKNTLAHILEYIRWLMIYHILLLALVLILKHFTTHPTRFNSLFDNAVSGSTPYSNQHCFNLLAALWSKPCNSSKSFNRICCWESGMLINDCWNNFHSFALFHLILTFKFQIVEQCWTWLTWRYIKSSDGNTCHSRILYEIIDVSTVMNGNI